MSTYDEDFTPAPAEDGAGRVMQTNRTRVVLFDGTTFTVRVSQRDKIQWDLVAPRKKWGRAQDVPFLAQSFVTYVAAKRLDLYTGSFDTFQNDVDELEDVVPDESDMVRPTKRGAGPGLS